MANQLKMAKVNAIKTLAQRGLSQRQIAETLGISRHTVARYLRAESSKCATSAPRVDASQYDSKCATSAPGSEATIAADESSNAPAAPATRSQCEPFRQIILDSLEQGLSAQRIYQDLSTEHGFPGSYYSVKRFVRSVSNRTPLPFRRLECQPAEEAQVDFGTGAPITTEKGGRRRTHVLRIVLSHSRKGYSESVFRQTTDNFIQCLENAFQHFGGVPRTLVIDNLRAAVTKADWYDPELNPKVEAFARHYGTTILPTRPRTPRHKGKVERGVDYVQENALKGKTFESLHQQNEHLCHWEETVADTRIHGTTKKQVGRCFRDAEQSQLMPLPAGRFPSFQEGRRRVHRDGHVAISNAFYSVPPEYCGREMWVRWTPQTVRIYDRQMQQVAIHARKQDGQFSTHAPHIATEKINQVERGAEWLLRKARFLGDETARWSQSMMAERGVAGVRVLQGLLSLANKYPSEQIEAACHIAWSHGEYRLQTIRKLLKRSAAAQETFDFMDEHPILCVVKLANFALQ